MGAPEESKGTKLLLGVIVAIVFILALVAIIIAAVSLGASNKPGAVYKLSDNGGSSNGQSGSGQGGQAGQGGSGWGNQGSTGIQYPPPRGKIWLIAVGHDWGAQEYIDSSGFLQGFHMDIIAEVCAAGNMQCRTVWEPYRNCYDSEPGQHSFGGKGLMGRWYDACTGWLQTVGRQQIFDFSTPFSKESPSFWYKKKGSSFDPDNFENADKLGFLDGWYSDEKCVARTMDNTRGIPLKVDQIVHYQTTDQIFEAINNGEIDAGFMSRVASPPDYLQQVGPEVKCSLGGASMMTRKDNSFNFYWNQAYNAFVSNGGYKKLCDRTINDHGEGREFLGCL